MTTALWRIATPDDAGAIHPIRTAAVGFGCVADMRLSAACNQPLLQFDQRRRPDTFLTAIATAFFWPTRTTSRLPAGRQVGSANLRIATTEDLFHLLGPRQLRHGDQLIQRYRQRYSLCDQPMQDIGRQIAQPHHPADEPI